jgi:hypothetical protein
MPDLKEAMEIAKKFIIDVNGDRENFLLEEFLYRLTEQNGRLSTAITGNSFHEMNCRKY